MSTGYRRRFLRAAVACVFALLMVEKALFRADDSRRYFTFILLDDQGWADAASLGYP